MIKKIKNWKSLLLVAILIFATIPISFASEQATKTEENEAIKEVIENYYTESYNMWMNLEPGDISKYLDLESVQSYNKIIALEENIERWKYTIEKGYFQGERKRHQIDFKYNSIKITDDKSEVKVVLSGETSGIAAYPFFVSLGENVFKLKKTGDGWLIYEHDYNDVHFYEKSKTEKLEEVDIERIRQEVDRENQ